MEEKASMNKDKTTKALLFVFTVLLSGNLLVGLRSNPSSAQGKAQQPQGDRNAAPTVQYRYFEKNATSGVDMGSEMNAAAREGFHFKALAAGDDHHVVVIMEKESGNEKGK